MFWSGTNKNLKVMQSTFTVTLSRGYIPDICRNVRFYTKKNIYIYI